MSGSARTTNLRPSPSRLVGRKRELSQLVELLGAGQRLVTVFGSAGTGKTRIAQALGEQLHDEYESGGGVWLCELAATRDLEGLCSTIARTLGLPPLPSSSDEQIVQRLGAAIAARGPVLLVLDNFEQLVELAPSTVGVWLAEAPELRLVITSREHLRLRGELRFELPPLSLPSDDARAEGEAAELLLDRVRALDPGFELDDRTAPLVAALVTRLEGIPLAIELAASQVELLGLQGLLDNLDQRLDVLVGDGRDMESRHATLRAAIDWSWSLLDPTERRVTSQCTVFRGGFTAEAARAVLQVPDAARPAQVVLRALRDKSLLRRDQPAEGPPRFSLFDAVRQFAAERLDDDDAHQRHAAFYLARADELRQQVGGTEGPEALSALALERDNLLAVCEHALSGTPDDAALERALRAVLALDTVASIRGPFASHLALLEDVVGRSTARAVPPAVWIPALRARAKARLLHGQATAALRDLELGLARATEAGDAALQAEVLVDQGVFHHQRRETEDARALYDRALTQARLAGARSIEGRVLGNLGALHHDRHELGDARKTYHEALELLRELGDHRLEAIHVGNLGVLELEDGEADRARAHLEASRELLLPLGDRRLLAIVLGNLGTLEHLQGQLPAARRCHEEALALLREVGDRRSEALCLSRLGRAMADLDWLDDARGCLAAADRLLGRFPDPMVAETIALDRGFLDVAQARQAHAAGKGAVAAEYLSTARGRTERVKVAVGDEPAWIERCDDIRFAVRLLERAFAGLGEAPASSSAPSEPAVVRSEAALILGPDGRWLQVPGGVPQDLRRRKALRFILVHLVEQQRAQPGAGSPLEALLEVGWPGERVMPSAGANRVYVALTTLRKLGLRKYLLSRDDGYLLDPALPVERVETEWKDVEPS